MQAGGVNLCVVNMSRKELNIMNSYPKHSSCRKNLTTLIFNFSHSKTYINCNANLGKKSEESVCSEFSSVISPSLPNNFMLLAPHFKRECVKKLMADFQNQMWSSFNGSDQLSVISWSGNQNSNCKSCTFFCH